MKKVVFTAGLLTVLNAAASVEVTPYIVNGNDISAIKYPSFVSLFYDRINYDRRYGVGPYCGATLLADQYVLTAAHCIYGDQDTQLFTSAVPQLQNESDFPYSVLQRVMVEEYYYPDTYNNTTLQDDIAILKLASPITAVSSYATFVDIANIGDYRKTTEAFYAVGHGNTQSNVDDSDTLQDTQLSFVDNANCNVYLNADTSENLCMTGAATVVYDNATCQGDSGGPLYWQGRQVGITSFGPTTCGDPGVEPNSVFTEVARYHDWIQSVLAGTALPKVVVNDQQRAEFLASGGATTSSITSTDDDSSSQSSSGGGGSLGALSMFVLALIGFRRKLHSSQTAQ